MCVVLRPEVYGRHWRHVIDTDGGERHGETVSDGGGPGGGDADADADADAVAGVEVEVDEVGLCRLNQVDP